MGVCTSHPYGASKDSSTFDASTCEVVYSDAAATSTDIAGSIGTTSSLPGTSTLPPPGTYGFPYMPFVPLEYIYDTDGNQLTVEQILTQVGNNIDISDFGYISAENSMWGVEGFVDITPDDGENNQTRASNLLDIIPNEWRFIRA